MLHGYDSSTKKSLEIIAKRHWLDVDELFTEQKQLFAAFLAVAHVFEWRVLTYTFKSREQTVKFYIKVLLQRFEHRFVDNTELGS